MLDSFRSIFGGLTVKETETEIIISGIRGFDIVRDISKHWKTSKITTNLFNNIGRNSLSFYKFFAPEVMYMLENIVYYRSRYTSVKMIAAIKDALLQNTWLASTKAIDEKSVQGRLNLANLSRLKFDPKPYQLEYFKNYTYRLDQYNLNGDLIAAAAGTGKSLRLDADIKIPGGWIKMGDVKVGDIVTAWDGTPTRVTGVYPQGKRQTFTIKFKDGREVDACDEHLWRVYKYDWTRYGGDGWKIINTKELFAYMQMPSFKNRLYIQLCKSEDTPALDLPIDPYNLGVILGDGCLSKGIDITKGDQEIFDLVKLPDNLKFVTRDHKTRGIVAKDGEKNTYLDIFRELGLMGKTALDKFIPDQYLHGSTEQRLAIIQGLMDTDGTVDENSNVSFCSSSYRLATQFQYLIRSLGGIAKIQVREPHYTYLGERREGNAAYRVNVRFPEPSTLFRLTRKRERCNDNGQYAGETLKLKITHVNLSERIETQCISVEHPDHLFITNDFIVTHNTYLTSAIAEMLDAELIVVMCPKNALDLVWLDSLKEMFHKPQTVWHTFEPNMPYKGQRWIVCHYDAMDKVVELLRNRNIVGSKRTVTILDESHNMNDPNSTRTKLYQLIVKMVGSRNNLLASGTPVKALGVELINLLRIVDPLFTPQVEERFKKMYGKEASKGLDIIRHRLGLVSYKVEKQELDLEPPIMRPYPIKIPNGDDFTLPAIRKVMEAFIQERWAYYKKRRPEDDRRWAEFCGLHRKTLKTAAQERAFKEYLDLVKYVQQIPDPRFAGEEIKATNQYEKLVFGPSLPKQFIHEFRDIKSVIKYTNLKIQGECLGRVLGGKRIECHVAMVPYVDWVGITESTHKKTIMFTSFVEAVEAADTHCVKLGMKPLAVYGKTTNELAEIVKRFDSSKELNPLNATYASLSTAVRLTMADTLILLNSPFRAYILEQAISRAYRLGQDSQVVVYQCSLDTGDIPNISTRSADILKWSQDQVEAIMGIKSPFEIGEAMEDHGDETEFDENKVIHNVLQKAFEKFDIEIPAVDFEIPLKPKSNVPAYLR
ncbi:hypothetical protein [Pseudomonas phage vB_PaeM_PS119XW]|uniref:Uncharacterized protein n=1 Tax=Pseudomonas phage vB_PaeM_PS119XW TaxID=2601632 RepID=A0A5C1K7V5_9CAUD|nr:DarB-like antirestriction [Pseudomonas phage vB_PaeM_PS119XW]QEM41960.1 hypothetical protein [Pseudomonas phage vB_PaeM_PS119XW]